MADVARRSRVGIAGLESKASHLPVFNSSMNPSPFQIIAIIALV